MLRQTLIIALASLGCFGIAQDPANKFSFKAPAAPAKQLFEELSKAAGVPLVAAGAVADDVLVLNLSDVTLSDAMDRIAKAIHGEWRKEGAGWVLYRGPNFEAADKRAEAAARVAEFRTNLNRIIEAHKKEGGFTKETAQKINDAQKDMFKQVNQAENGGAFRVSSTFNDTSQQTPAARAIVAILARMSDAQIANLTSGNRVVFSLNPTRMQVPLPGGSNQVVQQFVRDALVYKNVAQSQPVESGAGERRIVINGFGAESSGDGDPNLGVGYAILTNTPGIEGPNATLSLLVADPNGKTLASGQFFLGPSVTIQPPNQQPQPPTTNEKPLEISDLSKELAKVLGGEGGSVGGARMVRAVSLAVSGGGTFTSIGGGGTSPTPALSKELKERILNPEKFEPLGFAPGEAFSLTADAMGLDLVAYIPDPSFLSLNQIAGSSSITPSAFLKAVKNGAFQVVEEGGWLIASPKAPASARERRVNRQALGAALRLMNSKGYLSLEDWGAFASKQAKAPRFGDIDNSYCRLINTSATEAGLGQFSFGSGWHVLRFYASLGTTQKLSLTQGTPMSLNGLSAFQLGLVSEMVFNTWEGPNVQEPNQPTSGLPVFRIGGGNTIASERTFALPNGIPRDGYLNMTLRENVVAQGSSSVNGANQFFTPDSLAFERMRGERPELANFGPSVQFDQYRMASQRTFNFAFQFSPRVSMSKQLEDNTPGNLPYGPYERLPSDFRTKVDRASEQMKRGFGGGGGGNQIPPP